MSQIEHKNKTPDKKSPSRSRFLNLGVKYVLEAISDAMSFIGLWLLFLGVLMSRGEVDLTRFKPKIENIMTRAFAGETADVTSYKALWKQEFQEIEVVAQGVKVKARKQDVQTIDEISARFKIQPNPLEFPQVSQVVLKGGEITVERLRNGQIQAGIGMPGRYKIYARNIAKILKSKGQSMPANLASLRAVQLKSVTVHFVDRKLDNKIEISRLNGYLRIHDGDYELVIQGGVMGQNNRSDFDADIRLLDGAKILRGTFQISDLIPVDIAPKTGDFASIKRLDAPISITTRFEAHQKTGLLDLDLVLNAAKGRLFTGSSYKPFQAAKLIAKYKPEDNVVEIEKAQIDSEAVKGEFTGFINNIGKSKQEALNNEIGVDLRIAETNLNLGQKFDNHFRVRDGRIVAQINIGQNSVALSSLNLNFGTYSAYGKGRIDRKSDGSFAKISIDGGFNGALGKREILDMWPNTFALGARNWIVKSMQGGEIQNLSIDMNLDESDIANQIIANDHLLMKFDVENADIRYMREMPWLRAANGYGVLQGNQFNGYLKSGTLGALNIKSGIVKIPKLAPHGGDFTIDVDGEGAVRDMLSVTNHPPFEYAKKFQINPEDFKGNGEIQLHITRPLLEHFDQSRIRYALDGKFKNVELPAGVGAFQIKNGDLSLNANGERLEIKGPVSLGEWPANLYWRKDFTSKQNQAQFKITGDLEREHLDALGIGLRRHFGGKVGLTLAGQSEGLTIGDVRMDADFTNSELNIGALWAKAFGSPAKIKARIGQGETGEIVLQNVDIQAQDLSLGGKIVLANNLRLQELDIDHVIIKDLVNASLKAKPTKDGVLALTLSGDMLNVKTWVDKAFKSRSSVLSAPVLFSADVKTLFLDEDYVLKNASAVFSHTGDIVEYARLRGQIDGGEFVADLKHDEKRSVRLAHIEIPDASKAVSQFLGLDSIRDGHLIIDGQLPLSGQSGGLKGDLKLTDFTLERAPIFAQILSLASLTGLADTFSGSGIRFEDMDLKFALKDGVLRIRDARATGSALGLTGAGDIDLTAHKIDFSGVLVPSYKANSVLGDIPVVGDIVVGKKGEGMFAINYFVKGPYHKTQVSVNPLSALTPGIFRRIFDVKRDEISPEVNDLIESQKQKK